MTADKGYRVGVDVGGTKIAIALVDDSNQVLGDPVRFATKQFKEGQPLVDRLVKEVRSLLSSHQLTPDDVAGIGIGSPGPLDLKTGTVLHTPNMPMLENFGLKDAVQNTSGMRTEVNNDANCFVLGEALAGEAKHGDIVGGVTLGTGFGCGVVFNGEIYIGATGTAAEIAFCPYKETTIEEYVSGRGLSRMYEQRTGQRLLGPEIAQKAGEGDQDALAAFKEFGEALGYFFTYFINILDPDYIVVGGSISKDWNYFQESMRNTVDKYINPSPKHHLKYVQSKLGESAAIVGAAGLLLAAE